VIWDFGWFTKDSISDIRIDDERPNIYAEALEGVRAQVDYSGTLEWKSKVLCLDTSTSTS